MTQKKLKLLILSSFSGKSFISVYPEIKDLYDVVFVTDNMQSEAAAYCVGEHIACSAISMTKDRNEWFEGLLRNVRYNHIDLIFMQGFKWIIPKAYLDQLPPVINLHPAPLRYRGKDPQRKLYESYKNHHTTSRAIVEGNTIHKAVAKVDSGRIYVTDWLDFNPKMAFESFLGKLLVTAINTTIAFLKDVDKIKSIIEENMTPGKKVVLVLSGGMDSTTLLYYHLARGDDVVGVISFNYGQRHAIELDRARDTLCSIRENFNTTIEHYVIDLSGISCLARNSALTADLDVPEGHYEGDNMKLTVVPSRNLVFLSVASMLALTKEADMLSYGAHAGDHTIYPDCRQEFVDAAEQAIKTGNWGAEYFSVEAPFLHLDKAGILSEGLKAAEKLKISFYDIYKNTLTCYNGTEVACGKCGSCTERLEAFKKLNLTDPIVYKLGVR